MSLLIIQEMHFEILCLGLRMLILTPLNVTPVILSQIKTAEQCNTSCSLRRRLLWLRKAQSQKKSTLCCLIVILGS